MATHNEAHVLDDSISSLLSNLQRKGVRLWAEQGNLKYRAPRGALTPEDFNDIRLHRDGLIALLGRLDDETLRLAHRRVDCAPLADSQLAHWRAYRLSERPAIRQIASATRLQGHLDVHALEHCIAEIVRRHDALRTQIALGEDGALVQLIAASTDTSVPVIDLSALPEHLRESQLMSLVEQLIMQPIDVSVDRLWDLRLVRLADHEHALVVAMEHMISDQASMTIFLRELWMAYDQVVAGCPIRLPSLATQFTDFSISQQNARESWLQKHGAYWRTTAQRYGALRFPLDARLREPRGGWDTVTLVIGADLRAELESWCRARRTTLVMSVFTAYAALVLRWCEASEAIIRYQTDGRSRPGLENAIGYFATALYIGIELRPTDDFLALLERVTAAYCEAFEHADSSYLAAQPTVPEFGKNAAFNWVPKDSWRAPADESMPALSRHPIRFPHPMLRTSETDTEPSVLFFDLGNEIHADIMFPTKRFSRQTMQCFADNFRRMLTALVRTPTAIVADIGLSA